MRAAKQEADVFPLAAFRLLAENSHRGHRLPTALPHKGFAPTNSNTATGFQAFLYDEGRRSRSTGKERDAESGLDYFGARYYASNMGRFMSPDWAAKEEPVPYASLDNPQTLNLYQYMRNNPLGGVDPDGHCCTLDQIKTGLDVVGFVPVIGDVANAASGAISLSQGHYGEAALSFAAAVPVVGVLGEIGKGAELAKDVGAAIHAEKAVVETEKVGKEAISMTEAVDKAAAHTGGGVMEETGKGTNYQFRNTTTEGGNSVSKMGRFDVNPADPHVAKDGAHLNLETHVNGKPVGNEHIPIDPKTVRPGDHP